MKHTISICVTTFNRPHITLESFKNVLEDSRVHEIVIFDDGSDLDNRSLLANEIFKLASSKVKYYASDVNEGMSLAKKKAIELAEKDWCLILDSDNKIDKVYLDKLFELEWHEDTIYCPSFAKPHFDYTEFEGDYIDQDSIKAYMLNSTFLKLINTCNYFVNKKRYLDTYVYNPTIKAADTIWHNYNHLKNEGAFYIVPGMHYEHAVHSGSGWKIDANENRSKAKEIQKLIMNL
jgi:glycosyltransferase involved in cell wall biosynthesis